MGRHIRQVDNYRDYAVHISRLLACTQMDTRYGIDWKRRVNQLGNELMNEILTNPPMVDNKIPEVIVVGGKK